MSEFDSKTSTLPSCTDVPTLPMLAKVDLVTREAPGLPRLAIFSRLFPSEIVESTYKKQV